MNVFSEKLTMHINVQWSNENKPNRDTDPLLVNANAIVLWQVRKKDQIWFLRIAILNGQFKCTRETLFSRKISRSVWDSRNIVHFPWRSNPLFSGCMAGEVSKKDQNSFLRIAILNGQLKCTHWGALSRKISRSVWASRKVAHFAWRWFGQEFSIWLHILAWYCLRSDCSPLSTRSNTNALI